MLVVEMNEDLPMLRLHDIRMALSLVDNLWERKSEYDKWKEKNPYGCCFDSDESLSLLSFCAVLFKGPLLFDRFLDDWVGVCDGSSFSRERKGVSNILIKVKCFDKFDNWKCWFFLNNLIRSPQIHWMEQAELRRSFPCSKIILKFSSDISENSIPWTFLLI